MPATPPTEKPQQTSLVHRALSLLVPLVACVSVGLVCLTIALRIAYPYELEWMEGGVLDHITRLRAGEPIYVEPNSSFIPFIYPPLYYYLSSAAMRLSGDGFLGPRLVSLAALAGCAMVIFLMVRRETGRRAAALAAAALYVATYPVTGGWFDLARVDGLLPLFVLGGAYLIRFDHGAWRAALAGLLFTCAFFSKQSALVFVAPLLLFHLGCHPRRFPALAATSLGLSGAIWAGLHWRSGGWFSYYLFVLPRQHPLVPWQDYLGFWFRDLLPHLPIALAMIAALAILRRRRWRGRLAAFYAALAAGGLGVSWLSRLHTGGGVNVIMPAMAVIAVLFGIAAADLRELVDGLQNGNRRATERMNSLILVAVILQLLVPLLPLARNPLCWVPTAADRRAGDELVALIRELPGDVFVPSAPYLSVRADKPGSAHLMAMMDVLRASGSRRIKQKLIADVNRRLADPSCRAVLLCRQQRRLMDFVLPDDFIYAGRVIESPDSFRPKSGAKGFSPVHLFLRNDRRVACPRLRGHEKNRGDQQHAHASEGMPPAIPDSDAAGMYNGAG